MMPLTVGIPKEIKSGERRVGLTPKGVKALRDRGITVLVEKAAGVRSGFSNQDYEQAGAGITKDRKELWKSADLIKKVKEPTADEFDLIESRHVIFTYLHLASPSERPLVDALLRSKATAIGYETVEKNGETPLLKPMSELAGTLAAYFAAVFQHYIKIRHGELMGLPLAKSVMEQSAFNYPFVPEGGLVGQIMILGGGRVGVNAAKMAKRMGGAVFLSEASDVKRKQLSQEFKAAGLPVHLLSPEDTVLYESFLISCEIIIAAVHAAGERAPLVIDQPLLEKISKRKKKIILDVAIDQGGNVAGSKPVDFDHPLYLDSLGNLRFSVENMPSLCGPGASVALEQVTLEYTAALAGGVDQAFVRFPELKKGLNAVGGELVHEGVRRAHAMR